MNSIGMLSRLETCAISLSRMYNITIKVLQALVKMSEISATLTTSMPSIASKLHVGVSHAMNCDWPQPSEDASKILVVVNNV